MCGRYSFFTPIKDIELMLGIKAVEWAEYEARYNAAPTQYMPVVANEFPKIIQFFRWGLVPFWAKDIAIGNRMINTRAESIEEKPTFRNIFKYKRCVVLADSYYEWLPVEVPQPNGKKPKIIKQPYRIYQPGNKPFFMAGLWDNWGTDGLQSFSIITCEANEDLSFLHNRMPVILQPDDLRHWMDNKNSPKELMKFLEPAPLDMFAWYPVSTEINKPGPDHAGLIEEIKLEE